MNYLYLALISGACFGIYPLFLRQGNLPGFVAATFFTFCVAFWLLPITLLGGGLKELPKGNWSVIILAAVFSACGMLSMNTYLAKSGKDTVGILIAVMVLTQMSVAAIFHVLANSDTSPRTIVGFVFAAVAAYLLSTK